VDARAQLNDLKDVLRSIVTQPKPVKQQQQQQEPEEEEESGGGGGNYDVSFGEGPLGLKLTLELGVKGVDEGSQAHTGGVRMRSTIVAVAGLAVADMLELQVAIQQTKR
jgi:S1-C subfamily serine protease